MLMRVRGNEADGMTAGRQAAALCRDPEGKPGPEFHAIHPVKVNA